MLGLLRNLAESQNSPGYSRLSCFIMGLTVYMLLPLSLFLCSRVELAPTQSGVFLQGLVASSSAFEAVLVGRTTLAAILSECSGACDWGREALCVNSHCFLALGEPISR